MSNIQDPRSDFPDLEDLQDELERVRHRKRTRISLRNLIYALIVTAAVVILLAFLVFPVFRISGSSMAPTVLEGEIVISFKGSHFECGDVVVLSYSNTKLVKRVIAGPGEWFDMDRLGNVYVNGEKIDEPYLPEIAYGDCNLKLPYQVPDGKYFVMGDNRSVSQDSRSTIVGCIPKDQILGKVLFRIWPLSHIGRIDVNSYSEVEQ